MAEFVEQNLEEMIPELEQMQRVGLFTPAETRYIHGDVSSTSIEFLVLSFITMLCITFMYCDF